MNNIGEIDSIKIYTVVEDHADLQKKYLAQHGLSFLLKIFFNGLEKNILFDTGLSSVPILYNLDMLDISLNKVDYVFLSHCHNDHTGGLTDLLKEIDHEVPVIAHSDIFRTTYKYNNSLSVKGMTAKNSRKNIENNGGHLVQINEAFKIMQGVISTGEVKREINLKSISNNMYFANEGKIVQDNMIDDMSIVVNVREKGLLIITGCSHAGIVNIVIHAVNITGINKVYGIIGGFHLVNEKKEMIKKTINELQKFEINNIIAGHCTGLNALHLLSDKCSKNFEMLRAGKVIEL